MTDAAAAPRLVLDVTGTVVVSRDASLSYAQVRLLTPGGREFGTGISGQSGRFVIRLEHAAPPRFIVEASGGTAGGLKFDGHLRALVVNYRTDRSVMVTPATSIVAELARRDTNHDFGAATAQVKTYLGIPSDARLGDFSRWNTAFFDGRTFLREAGRHNGFDRYVQARATEIQSRPGARRFYRERMFRDTKASATSAVFTPSGVAQGAVAGIVSAVSQALIGDALSAAGYSNVANELGLGNKNEQLATITSQLDAVQASLTQINTSLTNLNSAISYTQQLVTQADYDGAAENADAISGVGGPADTTLEHLTKAAELASDIARAIPLLPSAAGNAPESWCLANNPARPANLLSPLVKPWEACVVIEADFGDGGPTAAQLIAAGGMQPWCEAHLSAVGLVGGPDAGTLIDANCEALGQTGTGAYQYASDDLPKVAGGLMGANGGTNIVELFDQYLSSLVADPTAPNLAYLSASNYSLFQDQVTANWAAQLPLAGLYLSFYEASTDPGDKPPCPEPNGPTMTVAACTALTYGHDGQYIAAQAKPDIPPNTIIALTPGADRGAAAGTEWTLVGDIPGCGDSGIDLFFYDDGYSPSTGLALWSPGSYQNPTYFPTGASCAVDPSTYSVGGDTGFAQPPTADLQNLFTGVAAPGTLLTSLGLPDLSVNANPYILGNIPAQTSFDAAYPGQTIYNSIDVPPGNTLYPYGVWGTCTPDQQWFTGYEGYFPSAPDTIYTNYIYGTFCDYLDLADGSVRHACTGTPVPHPIVGFETAPLECNAPWTPVTSCFAALGGRIPCPPNWDVTAPFDFGAQESVLLERPLSGNDIYEYWYPIGG